MQTFIERVTATRAGEELARWKRLRAEGWELTVLHSPADEQLIAFGYLPEGDLALSMRLETHVAGLRPA